MAWSIRENKLDDQQRDFVDNVNINQKNIWIKGFPGSGKSILLAYTIQKTKRSTPGASVVLVVFTQSLIEMFKAAFKEMGMEVNVETYFKFMKSSSCYDYVFCDEVQDLTPRVLREMNKRAQHIVVAGDSNQSIYESDPQYHESTVSPSEINNLLSSKEYELGIIHRLSKSIIQVVQKFLPRMNVLTNPPIFTDKSTEVRMCEARNNAEEVEYIMKEAKKAVNVGKTAGVLLPTQKNILTFVNEALTLAGKPIWREQTNNWGKIDFGAMNDYLRGQDMPLKYVGNGYGSFSESDGKITLMTYHSSKGLDFETVFLPFLNNSLFIAYDETLSKTLFMVALTRSRNNLYLTYFGYRHQYLDVFHSDCHHINIYDSLNAQTKSANNSITFGI